MVHEFFEIHGPWIFWNSWSMIFWNSMSQRFLRLWAIKQASPGRRGGAYYMIFHYQKHTVLNYSWAMKRTRDSAFVLYVSRKIQNLYSISVTLEWNRYGGFPGLVWKVSQSKRKYCAYSAHANLHHNFTTSDTSSKTQNKTNLNVT